MILHTSLGFLSIQGVVMIGMVAAGIPLILLLWGIKQPLAWVVVAVLAIAAGVGCTGYGLAQTMFAARPLEARQLEWLSIFIGAGLGSTVAGTVLLVVSLIRSAKRATIKM
jgi:hypothetical protein